MKLNQRFISKLYISIYLSVLAVVFAGQACERSSITQIGSGTGDNGTLGTASVAPEGRYRDPNSYNIGTNLDAIRYYDNTAIFADMALAAHSNYGRWDGGHQAEATLDSTGAPTVAAQAYITSDYPSGNYTITWDGAGSVKVTIDKLGPVTTTRNTDGTVHNSAVLTHTQKTGNWFAFSVTPPITNFHAMAPANLIYPNSYFMNDFILRLKPYTTIRFMGAQKINGSNISNWSERTWPTEGSRAAVGGLAYEDIIAIANLLVTDVWINVPALATDDYVCRMARLFSFGESGDKKDTACDPKAAASNANTTPLNSTSKVYIEYSNEIWGGIVANRNLVTAMAMGTSGVPSEIASDALANKNLPWATDARTKTTQLAKVLEKRISDIVKTVFAQRSSQVKLVLAVQNVYPDGSTPGFDFAKAVYGPLSDYFDYIGVAPYFAPNELGTDTLDDLFADLKANDLSTNPTTPASVALYLTDDQLFAQKYGLPLIAYEGGQSFKGPYNQTNKVAAQHDPRMYDMYQLYFSLWDQIVGRDHVFVHFIQVSGSEGINGSWGLLLHGEDPGSQKWDALMSLSQIPGDANYDGIVDAKDCQILNANFGQSVMWWAQGDFNHDGVVDAQDLLILNSKITGPPCTH